MAKLVEVLRQTVSPALSGRDVTEIGNKLFVKLDATRRVEMSLETAGYADNYEVLLFKLTDKNSGELHRLGVKFKDLLGVGKMVSEDYRNGGYCWYKATASDLAAVRNAVADYIMMWE